ncbi:MAG: LamB/YcsF family protein [Bacteroidota bacterium]|nr:LamB/YcsF family protein [Bacteroidota bacterium]
MQAIDLNCDMGEGLANDALLMPLISSANIACGYHAGNKSVMQYTIDLALAHGVAIGAHPGYADKVNFGRVAMQLSETEIYDLVTQQIFLLQKIADASGTSLHHVKPHGALYNQSANNPSLAAIIAQAVFDVDTNLILYGLSGSVSITEARKKGLKTANEVFADRTYQPDGSLTPRSQPNAMIETPAGSIRQVLQMIQDKTVTTPNGTIVPIQADTVCIHGDGPHALAFAKHINEVLQQKGLVIKSILS